MTAEQFAYWMQGFAELNGDTPPNADQWRSMREHLQTVFVKVTPPLGGIPKPPAAWRPGDIAYPLRAGCVAVETTAQTYC